MMTKNPSTIERNSMSSERAAQGLTNSLLPAGWLHSFRALKLAFAEQGKDQSHPFSGGEHEGSLMFVLGGLLEFGLVEGAVSSVIPPQLVSGFDEVVAQV